MKSDEKRFYEVEAWLRNELPPEQAAAFEAEMSADPSLAQQVAAQRAQRKVEELLIEDDLRSSIANWKTELEPGSPADPLPSKPRRFPFWALLGLGAVLVVAYFFLMKQPAQTEAPAPAPPPVTQPETPVATDETPENEPASLPSEKQTPGSKPEQAPSGSNFLALATRYEEVPAFAGTGVRSGDPAEDAFNQAMESLRNKEYEQATTRLRALKSDDPHWADAQYNLGCLFYLRKKYSQAIPFLKTAAENPDFLYSDNARWYWALCLLASEKPNEAKVQLDQLLKQPKGDFFKKAQELQKEIKK